MFCDGCRQVRLLCDVFGGKLCSFLKVVQSFLPFKTTLLLLLLSLVQVTTGSTSTDM